jgi:hypothetical protein
MILMVVVALLNPQQAEREAFARCDPTLRPKIEVAAPQLLGGGYRVPEVADFQGDWVAFGGDHCSVQVRADFNGDGRKDWAFILLGRSGFRVAGLVSQPDGSTAGLVFREEPTNRSPTRYIMAVAEPGEYETAYGHGYNVDPAPATVHLQFAGFWFSLAESIDWIYFWDGKAGRFVGVQISD